MRWAFRIPRAIVSSLKIAALLLKPPFCFSSKASISVKVFIPVNEVANYALGNLFRSVVETLCYNDRSSSVSFQSLSHV